jgi:isopentenyl diphosphate isomerase/L-lactate dehydrogenase-like FMN-dependent dehydrogenase
VRARAGEDWRRVPELLCVEDYRRLARRRLPRVAVDFIDGGADSEVTLRRNVEAFERLSLRPRHLVDVSSRSLETTVLGERVGLPVLIAPTGMSRVAGRGGDVAGARAAAAHGAVFVLSTMSSDSIEDVRAAATGSLWFQLYLWAERSILERLLDRARAAGCRALVVTVDVPVIGNRRRDARNGFALPPRVRWRTAADLLSHPRWLAHAPSAVGAAHFLDDAGVRPSGTMEHARLVNRLLANPGSSWRDLTWLRDRWDGPLLLKGTLTAEDARLAVECGVDGIVVSNHGGRQLDGAPASIDALAEVAEAVGDQVELLVDGGVRHGTDVIKARALGARAVLVGRPWLYGLAAGGEAGVAGVLEILRTEIDRALALLGRPRFDDVDASVLGKPTTTIIPGTT